MHSATSKIDPIENSIDPAIDEVVTYVKCAALALVSCLNACCTSTRALQGPFVSRLHANMVTLSGREDKASGSVLTFYETKGNPI